MSEFKTDSIRLRDNLNKKQSKVKIMSEQCCTTESCATTQKTSGDCECDMHEKLLALADEAWMELLKEKIKAEIEKTNGQHMDKIAKLVSDANFAKWGSMINAKVKCNEYKENLKALMSGGCST